MPDHSDSVTRITLLGRLRQNPHDGAAWDAFVTRYGGKIYGWCRAWDLQTADAEDVTQGVLLKLVAKMGEFSYDPDRSFRAWLKVVTKHALQDFLDARRRTTPGTGQSAMVDQLHSVPARDDLAARLEAAYDLELLEEAMRIVQERVAPQTWEAFHLLAHEGMSGVEVASRVGMQVSQVFVARHRVQKLLQEAVRELDPDPDATTPR